MSSQSFFTCQFPCLSLFAVISLTYLKAYVQVILYTYCLFICTWRHFYHIWACLFIIICVYILFVFMRDLYLIYINYHKLQCKRRSYQTGLWQMPPVHYFVPVRVFFKAHGLSQFRWVILGLQYDVWFNLRLMLTP